MKLLLFYEYVCVHVYHVSAGAQGGQRRALDPEAGVMASRF